MDLLDASAVKISRLCAEWLRVGFCQGNFNADNCLIGGRTMDYGPFGFVDKYDPGFAKWTGSGDHFAFANQPQAGFANWQTLVAAVAPAYVDLGGEQGAIQACVERATQTFQDSVNTVWKSKLGFVAVSTPDAEEAEVSQGGGGGGNRAQHVSKKLFSELEPLMRKSEADYTITWRQLAAVVEAVGATNSNLCEGVAAMKAEDLVAPLMEAFYEPPIPSMIKVRCTRTPIHTRVCARARTHAQTNAHTHAHAYAHAYAHAHTHTHTHTHCVVVTRPWKLTHICACAHAHTQEWSAWIKKWLPALVNDGAATGAAPPSASELAARLRSVNPKYVPREWMCVLQETNDV